MSMDDIGAGIGTAALIGLRVGTEMQNRRVLQEWIDYSGRLEEQLRQSQQALAIAKAEISQIQLMMQLQKEIIEEKDGQIAERDEIISRLNAQVRTKTAELERERNEHESTTALAKELLKENERNASIADISYRNAYAMDSIYKELVEEICRVGDPSQFTNLDPEIRSKRLRDANMAAFGTYSSSEVPQFFIDWDHVFSNGVPLTPPWVRPSFLG